VVNHAHNDWIEGTVELGWFFPLAALGAAAAFASRARGAALASRGRLGAGTAIGAAGALAALGAHALVDFPLQIPAILWIAAVLAGLVSAAAPPDPRHRFVLRARPSLAAACCALAALLLFDAGRREARAESALATSAEGLLRRDAPRALAQARAAVLADPLSARAHAALGRTLVAAARFGPSGAGQRAALEAARGSLERAASLNPRDADAWIDLAKVSETLGDLRAADAASREAVALEPRSGVALEARAAFLLDRGRRTEAVELLSISARADARALPRIFSKLWRRNPDPDLLFAVTPRTARDLSLLGDFLETKGQMEPAREALARAAALAPRDSGTAARLVGFLTRRADPATAVSEARRAIARGAGGSALADAHARALVAGGDLEAARLEYTALLEQPAARAGAIRPLADVLARLGRPREVARLWERAVAWTPGDPEARRELARAHMRSGGWSRAVETCRALLAVDPDETECAYLLADLYAERGLHTAAQMALRERLARRPADVGALARLARIYESLGRFTEARAQYARILTLEPGNAEARAGVGRRATPPQSGGRRITLGGAS
jgi:tetratricopeptide (TPR) repeat protein